METNIMPPEPPVRFYKTIALSFLVITMVLLGVIIFTTTKKAAITIMAKGNTKNVTIAVDVAKQKDDGFKGILGVVSSTNFQWSETYYPTSAKTVNGTAAGEVTLYNRTNVAQALVKTTRLLSTDGILFRLSDKVVVPANGQTSANVYSDQPGAASDINASQFTIPGLNPDKQKMIYAESTKPMTGGARSVKVLTQEDLDNAKKDYLEKAKSAFLKDLTIVDQQYNQKIVSITESATTSSAKVGDEVSEFKVSGGNTMAYVFYSQDELAGVINKEMAGKIDPTSEKILSSDAEPKVALLNYDVQKGAAQLSVVQDLLITLDANAEKLAAKNFIGKKKDEIERYVLGLNHAAGVEIKMTPSWSWSAPSVEDKIKVVVKNVQ
ncbi:hypothetical protein KKA13_02770 [Patescibacteria group bacterium]|nr:hypothetical protein [Patescibacteria group bacterium]MBU1613176.1 hypothetical protein [Patescibacteria group bacterium]